MENFNPDEFLAAAQEGVFDAKYEQIRPGEYQATILEVKNPRRVDPPAGADWKSFGNIDIVMELDSQQERERLNRAKLVVTYQMRLDLDDNGKLDGAKNRNVPLGQLQEACGITPPWSWQAFIGKRVTAKAALQADKKDPQRSYERVVAVAKPRV